MGRSNSKFATPSNPMQELQVREIRKKTREMELDKRDKRDKKAKTSKKTKPSKKEHRKRKAGAVWTQQASTSLRKEDFEARVDAKLREQLSNNLTTFGLNQVALSIRFFGNYESERNLSREYILQKENQFNQNLEEHSVIFPNCLDKAVERRMRFKAKHGPEKHEESPLQLQTMYVVFENIDISKPNEANYDSITPICKVDMETDVAKSIRWKGYDPDALKVIKFKGYVWLKLRESSCSTSGNKRAIQPQRANVSDSEYDYAYITHLNTHHPLDELTMTTWQDRLAVHSRVLPDSCISNFRDFLVSQNLLNEDDSEEEEYSDEEEIYASGEETNVCYLNSKSFLCYFGDLLRGKLANDLGLDENEFGDATYRGASIHTKTYEIIPAIQVAHNARIWPDCAFEFKLRERPISVNPLTGQKFQWPTAAMIKRIESFGFYLIPLGYAPKIRRNHFRELEWKIVFPKAERFLEENLTEAQIKVFMICKALVKTFVEPQQTDRTLMFTIDHLRMHLFWECERNYSAWPEEFLGEVLIRFLKSFIDRLSNSYLPDFFIQDRNMFECIPESSLSRIRNIISDVVENPLVHLMAAYRNLHGWEGFLPKLNYNKIYANFVENDIFRLKMLSKNSRRVAGEQTTAEEESSEPVEETKKSIRRRTLLLKQNIEMKRRLEYERARKSVDSIDLEFIFERNISAISKRKDFNEGAENLRRTNVLEVFIENFIQMAEKLITMRTIHLAKIYLNQARRLCRIYHDYGCDSNAFELLSRIEGIESDIEMLRTTSNDIPPPALPVRMSLEPMRVVVQNGSVKGAHKRHVNKPRDKDKEKDRMKRPSVRFADEVTSVQPRKFVAEVQVHVPSRPVTGPPLDRNEEIYGYLPAPIVEVKTAKNRAEPKLETDKKKVPAKRAVIKDYVKLKDEEEIAASPEPHPKPNLALIRSIYEPPLDTVSQVHKKKDYVQFKDKLNTPKIPSKSYEKEKEEVAASPKLNLALTSHGSEPSLDTVLQFSNKKMVLAKLPLMKDYIQLKDEGNTAKSESQSEEGEEEEEIPVTFKARMARVHQMLLMQNVYSDPTSESTNV